MRLVMRAEFRSVTWAGSMVTGSARSPMTMASLGGAAPAPDARATARITRDSVAIRRIVMVGSFGRSSCLKALYGAIPLLVRVVLELSCARRAGPVIGGKGRARLRHPLA